MVSLILVPEQHPYEAVLVNAGSRPKSGIAPAYKIIPATEGGYKNTAFSGIMPLQEFQYSYLP
jgi:hypothetical protein